MSVATGSIVSLLERLQELDIQVRMEGDRLRLNAPSGALTPDLRDELTRRKADLVDFLRRAQEAAARPSVPSLHRRDGAEPPPLSFAQQRLWFLHQMSPESSSYNVPGALRLRGPLSAAALERALNEVAARHEVLRTTFPAVNGVPVPSMAPLAPPGATALPRIDLSGLPAPLEEAERLAAGDAEQPFDLERGPLWRHGLLRLGPDDHIVVVTLHHIVADGWSVAVLFREVAALYGAFTRGLASPLPDLPVQYADFAAWQRRWLASDDLRRQLDFWRRRLSGAPPRLDLPTDHPRSPERSPRGAREELALPPALGARLAEQARSTRTSLFMLLLAGFQTLLHRYTGQGDLSVGAPFAGRNQVETEPLIGCFINTLVMRATLRGEDRFSDLLSRTRETVLEALAHQDLPFETLVEELQPERSLHHPPLFQVLFNLLNTPPVPLELPGARVEPFATGTTASKLDLTLAVRENGEDTILSLLYDPGLFEPATMRRMLAHLQELLAGIAADPELRLADLPLLTAAERHSLLREWSRGEELRPAGLCIHELFSAQAARTPDAEALVCEDTRLTYRELDRLSNRLARRLLRLGVENEVRIGICAERSAEMIVGLLGVLKAGGAYVPLDPTYPEARLAAMIEDAGVDVLLAQEHLLDLLPAADRRVVLLAADPGFLASEGDNGLLPRATPANLAYVLFTSGSTGRPKGVAVEHRQLACYTAAVLERLGLDGPARFATVSTLSADLGNTSLFPALLTGGTLHVITAGRAADPRAFAEYLDRHPIDCLKIVPSHLRALRAGERPEATLPRRRLVFGGEALPRADAEEARALAPGCLVFNHYGPTETTVGALTHLFSERDPRRGPTVPLGRPLPNVRAYVVDAAGRPVPGGVPGELQLGGAGLARGYLGRPDLTAARFLPDPFGPDPGERLYSTGDLVRFLPDGRLEFLGRIDQQVKVRGFRVEPGEVEAALLALPAVSGAAVVAREHTPGDLRLVAFVAPAPGADPSPESLRGTLRGSLPEWLIPPVIAILPALPLNANGKVDRQALARLAPEAAEAAARIGERAYEAPRSPVETTLAGIWASLLGVERVGTGDSFFALGGHSLLATRLIARVREGFGVDVPLRSLFEAPTLEAFARVVLDRRVEARYREEPAPLPLGPSPLRGTTDRFPCSFSQQRLWFLHEMDPSSPAYNVPSALRLAGPLDPPSLARALTEVARRHEVLRSTFESGPEGPVQIVGPVTVVPLPCVDLAGLPPARGGAELERRLREEAARPFDLARGPVLRALLLRLAPEEQALLVCVHHIVSDAWSRGLLVHETAVLYGAFRRGEPSPLPELPLQYADFADWQRRWLQGDVLAAQVEHWRRRLAGAPPLLALPTDRPRRPVQSTRGDARPFAFPAGLLHRLEELARAEGTTLFAVLLTAFQALLCRWSGQEDVSVGAPVAGRRHRETEELIGFFVNTLVMRADLAGDPPFRAALRANHETLLDDHAHQDVPFEKLVDELRIERSLSRTPLFQVMLALQNAPRAAVPTSGPAITPVEAGTGTSKFDLTLTLAADEEGLAGALEYSTDLFDGATAERFLGHFGRLLAAVADDPGRPLWSLPLLGPEERHHLVSELGTGAERGPVTATLHGLFAARAAQDGGAVAVTCDGARMTYAELDAEANRWASRLCGLGVGPEVRVGLCVERSMAMVVGILAILKAGGAYVPLDPAYPEERLRFLLADSGIRVLLTQTGLLERLTGTDARLDAHIVDLEDPREAAGAVASDPAVAVDPDHLAYVIYTSGSTGRPKGVGVTHANAARLFTRTEHLFGFGPADVWTLFHSHAFDFSVWEIWGALLYGGRLVVVPWWVSRSPADFRTLLEAEGVTVLNQTPSAFRQLIEADAATAGGGLALRWVVFGGEALDLQSLRPWFDRHGDRAPRLVNMYGITETTVHVTWRPIDRGDLDRTAASVIGVPLPDLSLDVLDRRGEPAPLGVPGEMYVGGAGVARGYLGRPGLTAERFVPDPFGREPGGRLYRSGDLARLLPGGDLEYLGRIDHQVKIRGFRIELGEIEAALAEHPAVRQAVVLAREAPGNGEKRLVAWLVTGAEPLPSLEELRAFLRRHLPEHMLPAAFVPLAALPLTAHGKIDRAKLPEPEAGRSALAGDFVPPRTPEEAALAAIWAEVLRLDRVGADDNFFALGGDSILSLRIRSLAAAQGLAFELQDLFRYQTLAELAAAARSAGGGESPRTDDFALVPPGDRDLLPPDVEDAHPLSLLQLGMLFHSGRGGGSMPYHNVSSFRLRGPFDAAALERALRRLAERHPVLRASIDPVRFSEPLQLVHREPRIPLEIVDLRGWPPAEQERRIAERFDAERHRAFDWTQPPLLRLWAHTLDEDTFELGITEHHAILDGWSFATLLAELFALYFAEIDGAPSPLPPPPHATFRDFVALERSTLESEESRRFWNDALAGSVPLELPRGPEATTALEMPEPRIHSVPAVLSAAETGELDRAARAAGVPLKSVLLAAHLRVLVHLGGDPDVVTGLVVNGRPETADGDRALGLFLNTVPLRLRLAEGSWAELAQAAFAAERETMPHRRFPLAEMQRTLGDGQPLFEATFNYVHFHVLEGIDRLELLSLRTFAETDFALTVHCSHSLAGGLEAAFLHDAGRLRREQVLGLAELWAGGLRALARDPGARWDSPLPLEAAQRHQLLVEWNDTSPPPLPAVTVHALVEARAAAQPGLPAVIAESGSLAYGELAGRARRLARHLRALGVGPEARVAVAMEHSPERVTVLLAVLLAGGAFVSLDPGDPPERRSFLLADCGASFLLDDGDAGEALAACAALSADPFDSGAGPDHLAYVIYTSGSTGRPKGVGIPHRGLLSLIRWHLQAYRVQPGERATQLAGTGFDASVWELWPHLAAGATVVIPPAGVALQPSHLVPWLAEQEVAIAFLPTGLAELALAERWTGTALRALLVGGDRLLQGPPPGLGFPVVNHYGPTEGSVVSTAGTAEPGGVVPPIGRPILGVRTHVVGRGLRPVPAGMSGELWIGGDALARGYLGRPDLTAERFVPDPYGGGPGARLYRTGDRVRALPDGRLQFLGRIDHQVKIRGIRVELGEIEAALVACPGVREAVVVAREVSPGDRRLVAYVTAGPEGAPDPAALRDRLQRALPGSMVPAAFVVLDALPLTPNGKVDRRALPAPEAGAGRAAAPPRDEVELELARIWEEMLGVSSVGIDDGFFDLGGHSLLAVRLMGRIERRFGRRLPISVLLQHPTVARLSRALRGPGPAARPPLVAIQPHGSRPPFFCVHPTGGNVLCYHELARQLGPDQPFYGLQSTAAPPESLEAMAAAGLASIREVQPSGPYRLGGWSMGGVLAYEMARQLESSGEEVALLAILDATADVGDIGDLSDLDGAGELSAFAHDLARLTGAPLPDLPPGLLQELSLERLLEVEEIRAALPDDMGAEQVAELFVLFRQNLRCLRSYRPAPYGGRINLIRAEETALAKPADGWSRLAGRGAEIHLVPGDHYSMLRPPHVRDLAARLAEGLR